MKLADGVEVTEGKLVYRETPEGRIEGMVAKTNDLPPRDDIEMIHVIYEVHDAMSKTNDLVDGNGWWPASECYSTVS